MILQVSHNNPINIPIYHHPSLSDTNAYTGTPKNYMPPPQKSPKNDWPKLIKAGIQVATAIALGDKLAKLVKKYQKKTSNKNNECSQSESYYEPQPQYYEYDPLYDPSIVLKY